MSFSRISAAVAGVALLAGSALAVGAAAPASAKAASTGDFTVTVNGTRYDAPAGKDIKISGVRPTTTIKVRGIHVAFDLDPVTFGVYDYTLTGAANPDRMVTSPTVVFASKVPALTAAQRANVTIKDLEVRDDSLVATLQGAGGKLKVQAKDAPTGGIFQMEPEFGTSAVEITHTLGAGLFYFTNQYTGKINFGNGLDPVSSPASAAHQMLLGKDSPQVATKTFQDGTTTRWSVASGGRMGGVLGEDAIELSQGATNCTSQCQAQNRIRGSLPVPPLPTNPTPLP